VDTLGPNPLPTLSGWTYKSKLVKLKIPSTYFLYN